MKVICHWNINGFDSKREQLELYLDHKKVDVICLNETKPTHRTTFEIDGFTLAARRDRANLGGGGVAILVRNYMDATEIDLDTDDICAITTTIDGKKTCIISCYWGFAHRGIPTLDTLKDLLSRHKHSIILGDFNAYHPTWGHQQPNERGRAIRRLCKEFDLHLQNNHNQPTFHNHSSDRHSTLDLALASPAVAQSIMKTEVQEAIHGENTYHCPLALQIRTNIKDHPIWTSKSLNKCDWEKYQRKIMENFDRIQGRGPTNSVASIDKHVEEVTATIASCLHDSCPTIKSRQGLIKISRGLLDKIKLKRDIQREIRQFPDYEPLKLAYRNITKEIKTQLHEEKKAAQMREVEALNPKDSQQYWRTINNLTGQTKPEKKPIKLINLSTNTKTKTEMETANTFAKQLAKVHRTHSDIYFNHEHKAEVDTWAESMKEHLTPRSTLAAPSDEYSRIITSEDTHRALKSLKNKTSPGEDTIPYIALKNLPEPAIDELTKIFGTCLQIGYFPKKWKHAIGKMIQKPNKPKDNPASYRPISLLNCMGKLFEKIISNRIQEFIEDNNIINPWQRAYQPHKEANEHIMIINEYMKKVKENKKLAALLLMDVEKAFDAVWHNGLLKKLHDMELPGDILRIISSFLTDRTIQVRIGNTLSEVVKLLAGTPQGSILSPLLFILFVNDIPVTPACQVTQYADDIAIYTSHRNPRYLEAHLQKQVDELEDWCEDWFIKLNAKKTQLMIITRQNSRKMIPITVRNNQVEIQDSAILLGTTLDRTMNLKPHITSLINKTAPRIEKLRQLQLWGAHQAALKTFYTSMIRPILEIGYHLTHDHKPSLEALQKVQNKCLRMITWTSPHESSKPSHEIFQLPYIQSYLEQCRTKALKRYEDSELQQHLSEVLEAV